MTRPTTTGKAQDLITFTRSTTGTALAKISYGEELVTNGTFDNNIDGWSVTGSAALGAWNAGKYIDLDRNGGTSCVLWKTVSGTGVSFYEVSFDVVHIDNGTKIATTFGGVLLDATAGAVGTYKFYGFAAGSPSTLFFSLTQTSAAVASLDNISVKEVLYDQPDGTLQLFNHPINKPRIEYDASGNCLGLLVEEARTNKVAYSQDFTNSYWAKNDLTVAPAPVAAPDGTMTATHVVKTGSNAHLVALNIVSTADRHSIWARTVSGTGTMYIGGTAPDMLVTVTEEWQRLDVQCNNSHVYAASLRTDATLTEVYIWGSQAETGTFPTSYIPTSGSAVTRAADIASLAVSEFGYNQDQGSVVVEQSFFADSDTRPLVYIGESNANRILLYRGNGAIKLQVKSGNNTQVQQSIYDDIKKAAFRYKKDDMVLAANGLTTSTDTSASLLAQQGLNIYIGRYNSGPPYLNGHIKSVQYYPLGLSNAQLQALTV